MHDLLLLSLLALHTTGAGPLPRSTPEAEGVSSAGVLAFIDEVDQIDAMNSFMLVRHGKVIAEGWWAPYRPEARHSLYSLSKSFTSTAVGMAVAEGKLSADDPVLKFFPEEAPSEPSANLKAMRVSDLLRMSTGQQTEPPRKPEENWVRTFLAHPVPFKPGTHFLYNTSATYMQSAIVQQATGENLLAYLQPRLFEQLGIEDPTWEMSPQGVVTGGYGLSVRTEDIAKFGQLYLQKGKWNGKQLVAESWIDAATARQTSNGSNPNSDWDQGYGYQFWRCRHQAYRGDGAFGQYCVVLPEKDAVIAITSGLRDMQAVLNHVWDKLLPAFDATGSDQSQQALQKRLKQLSVRMPNAKSSPASQLDKVYSFEANPAKVESLFLKSREKGTTALVIKVDGKEQEIACGSDGWIDGRAAWGPLAEQPIAAAGAWTADNTFTARICFYETPFIVTARLAFNDDAVTFSAETNVGFGNTKQPELVGKIK